MTKPIEDSANASAIRTALDVPTTAALNAKYTKPASGIPAADLEADPAGRVLLTATSAAERKQVLGLDQVNNTSDANKPVSTAQATAIGAKMDATLPALQTVFDGGTAAQKAAFQSAVSDARKMIALNRQRPPTYNDPVTAKRCYVIQYVSPSYEIRNPKFCFPGFIVLSNGSSAPETATGSVALTGCAIRVNGGPKIAVPGSTGTVPAGGHYWTADANWVTIPPRSTVALYVTIDATGSIPTLYMLDPALGDLYATSSTSVSQYLTDGNEPPLVAPGEGVAGACYAPCLTIASGWAQAGKPPVGLILGDSIHHYRSEAAVGQKLGARGYAERGLLDESTSRRVECANWAISATKLLNLADTAGQFSYRKAVLAAAGYPFTFIASNMGINDLSEGIVVGVMKTRLSAAVTFLRTLGTTPPKIVWHKMLPYTAQSGGTYWTDLAGQTSVSWIQNSVDYDALLDTLPYGIDAVVTPRTAVAAQSDANKWAVQGFAATLSNSPAVGATSFYIAGQRPSNGDCVVIEPGLANAELVTVTRTSGADAGPWQCFIVGSFTKSHSSGAAVAAALTDDGLHMSSAGHRKASAVVSAAKAAGVYG